MKPIKVESSDMKRVLQSDNRFIQIGERKFLLVEVENAKDNDCY